jgi:hypothetical protein
LSDTLLKNTMLQRLYILFALLLLSLGAVAQVIPSTGYTAAQLVDKLAGPGVTVSGASLICAGGASGEFTATSSNLGIDCGVVLTTGQVVTGAGHVGINITNSLPANANPTNFASTANGTPGDADLTVLAGPATNDACILEFDFIPVTGSVSFDYVFGSEEYNGYTCSPYNDVFGFFISGGSYATPTNIALVPGTSIPVAVNSVNCGATGGWPLSTCTALGTGSPFCSYYVNNSAGTTVTYDGFTTVLTASATVTPCVTHHFKLGIADASDNIWDSGVFLKAGSLTSPVTTVIIPSGLGGPYAVRTCAPGKFTFNTTPRCTPTTINFQITGSAINGYDYSTIPSFVTIPAFASSAVIDILPLAVPPTGPKTVTLTVLKPDHCDPTLFVPDPTETATITIYDSFQFKILTPDTVICKGEHFQIRTQTDPLFGSFLAYSWTPTTNIDDPTLQSPTVSPTVNTTYVVSVNIASGVAGCPDTRRSIFVKVNPAPEVSTDSPLVKTCVGVPVQLHSFADPDTMLLHYEWNPSIFLSNDTISNPIVTPMTAGDFVYTVSISPMARQQCKGKDTIRVHVVDWFTVNPDTVICLGATLPGIINGSNEFTYRWRPATFVSDSTSMTPGITPDATILSAPYIDRTITYTVVGSYAHCPDSALSFSVKVDTQAHTLHIVDTICLGMSYFPDVTVPGYVGSSYYSYNWSPTTFVSNDTIPTPVITPTLTGNFNYVITVKPRAVGCDINDVLNLQVLPNVVQVFPKDTGICKGEGVQVRVAGGDPAFSYQWLPTAGIAVSNVFAALIEPDTSATYMVTAHFRGCPDIHDTMHIDVRPRPSIYIGGNRFVCQFDTLHMVGGVSPTWYQHYSYAWTPAASLNSTTGQIVVFTGQTDATVIVTVSTANGRCTAVDSAKIMIHPGNFASITPALQDFCPHDSAVLSPAGGVSYVWSPALYLSDNMAISPVIKPITTQTYSIVATSEFGCKDTLTYRAIVHPAGLLYLGDSVTIYPGETYQARPQTNCTSFSWFPPAGLNDPYISDPIVTPGVSTQYIVTGFTEYNCPATDTLNINVSEESVLGVPNAFVPGNGPNNEFKIIKRGLATLKLFPYFQPLGKPCLRFQKTSIRDGMANLTAFLSLLVFMSIS